ncbi:patatin [Pukyongia salina]|uniref:Patatin n=1 Tax=Pukyongia salina TaxID=2094025 RepID=A0A2S0HZS3_9FLAO|nr:patatin-like phospholipase family protein [Pukyongia salina]AVI52159.1 patatin [Pukyongia salina]
MNLGVVLSGGGIRGVAHIGALQAMEEFNLKPTHISGTSAGAIVGGLYAAGIECSEILKFFKTIPIFQRSRYARRKPGFIDSEKFYDEFRNYMQKDDFSSLQTTLYVTATDLLKGTLKIFHEGELIRPILASASFPGLFSPVEIGDSHYIDGGVFNNFPVEPLRPVCDKIIGVYVNPVKPVGIDKLKHSYNVVERAYKLKSAADSILKFKQCDLVISPSDLSLFGTFDMKYTDAIYDIGYRETKRLLEAKLEVLVNS